MPENDFEKEVQQLFDGLKLKPTAEVWTKVQTRIRKDKRKRRFVLWLPLLLLMLGTGSYWIAVRENNPQIASTSATENSDGAKSAGEKSASDAFEIADGEQSAVVLPPKETDSKKTSAKTEVNQDNNKSDLFKEGRGSDLLPSAAHAAGGRQLVNNKALDLDVENVSVAHPAPVVAHVQMTSDSFNLIGNNAVTGINELAERDHQLVSDHADSAAYTYSTTGFRQSVVSRNTGTDELVGEKIPNSIRVPSLPLIKLGKKKLWEFGIEGGAGVSKVGKGITDLLSLQNDVDKSAIMNDMTLQNSSNTISNLTGRNNIYVMAIAPSASPVRRGMGWHLGAFTKWHFKDRLSLSAGLRYNYFSTHRQVGKIFYPSYNNVSQSISTPSYTAIYPGDATNDYTNKYHFVTLPVGLQWQVNRGIKLPIELSVGADLSWMATTNALHYNGNTGSYFEDKARFNKFQAGIYTGVSVRLFQHNKYPLDIGPVFQYNITNLLKKGYDNNQSIIYGGITVRLVLWKK